MDKKNITSTISFRNDDKQYCIEVCDKNTVVIAKSGKHDHGSSQVKLKNIVDYKWEARHYPGRLIAVHADGKIIAYSIKVTNRNAGEGMVRVVHIGLGQRALIKGMSNEVLDLEFAHIQSKIYLAFIEESAVHIHRIETLPEKILCNFIVKIKDQLTNYTPRYDRISWCPFMPENKTDLDENTSLLLVWTRGCTFQCYSISTIIATYGSSQLEAKNITEGCLKYKDNPAMITSATFSPDGTTLAVTCVDGLVRFYQVYLHTNDSTPRCLHEWKPHDGKEVTNLFFLDNHSEKNSTANNELWKHAATFSEFNTEIKIWSCESWTCLQTISFKPAPDSGLPLIFKAKIDRTSSYLLLSDMTNRQLYVLEIYKDLECNGECGAMFGIDNARNGNAIILTGEEKKNNLNINNKIDTKESNISSVGSSYVKSIAEFPLSSSILSYGILNADITKYKSIETYLMDDEDYDEESNARFCVVIHMFVVHPKSVQECHVLYQPALCAKTTLESSSKTESDQSFEDKTEYMDQTTSELNLSNITSESPKISNVTITSPNFNQTQKQSSQINLMTPDSFNSPIERLIKNEEAVSQEVLSTLFMLANATNQQGSSPNMQKMNLENMHVLNLVNNKIIEEEQLKLRKSAELINKIIDPLLPPAPNTEIMLASGGSSPSREVREIMSLKDPDVIEYYSDNILDEADGIATNDEIEMKADIKNTETFTFKNTIPRSDDEDDEEDEDDEDIENDLKEDLVKLTHVVAAAAPKVKANTTITDWPKVPEVPVITTHQSSDILPLQNANKRFDDLAAKMNRLLNIVQAQSLQIDSLRNEIFMMQKASTEENANNVWNANKTFEKNIPQIVEEALVRHEIQQAKTLENLLTAYDKQNIQLHDTLLRSLTQMIYTQFSERMPALLMNEIKFNLVPLLSSQYDDLRQKLSIDMTQKMQKNDEFFKEHILKICSNQNLMDQFGKSVTGSVKFMFENSYKESMANNVIPSFEKASKEMFKQLQTTYVLGIKEITKSVEQYMAQYSIAEDHQNEIINSIKQLPDQIKSSSDKMIKASTSEIIQDVGKDFKLLQVNLMKSLKEHIRNEIQKGLETQTLSLEDSVLSVVRSQAQTPAPSVYDIQENIKQYLNQGAINKAFHTALLANDLNMVEYTLEKADYKTVFNPCPLEQTVLLSLIQQISADMSCHNELKQRYLSDAIVSLNFRDPITKEHAPKVMKELYQNCQSFISAHPTNALSTNIKMLLIAIQGLGFKHFI